MTSRVGKEEDRSAIVVSGNQQLESVNVTRKEWFILHHKGTTHVKFSNSLCAKLWPGRGLPPSSATYMYIQPNKHTHIHSHTCRHTAHTYTHIHLPHWQGLCCRCVCVHQYDIYNPPFLPSPFVFLLCQ